MGLVYGRLVTQEVKIGNIKVLLTNKKRACWPERGVSTTLILASIYLNMIPFPSSITPGRIVLRKKKVTDPPLLFSDGTC